MRGCSGAALALLTAMVVAEAVAEAVAEDVVETVVEPQESRGCVFRERPYVIGERWVTGPPDKCAKYLCEGDGQIAALTCPWFVPAPGCSVVPGRDDAVYPECCPLRKCHNPVVSEADAEASTEASTEAGWTPGTEESSTTVTGSTPPWIEGRDSISGDTGTSTAPITPTMTPPP